MLRPWLRGFGTCEEDRYTVGDIAWARRLAAPQLHASAAAISSDATQQQVFVTELTRAQRRKLDNVFAAVRHGERRM